MVFKMRGSMQLMLVHALNARGTTIRSNRTAIDCRKPTCTATYNSMWIILFKFHIYGIVVLLVVYFFVVVLFLLLYVFINFCGFCFVCVLLAFLWICVCLFLVLFYLVTCFNKSRLYITYSQNKCPRWEKYFENKNMLQTLKFIFYFKH